MKIIQIGKSNFYASRGSSIYDLEHDLDEYVICVYGKTNGGEIILPSNLTRTAVKNNKYRMQTTISTGVLIYDVIVMVERYSSIEKI